MSSAVIAVLAAAAVTGIVWQIVVQPVPSVSLGARFTAMSHAITNLPEELKEMVGIFGWLNVTQAPLAYVLWPLTTLTLLLLGWQRATTRERAVLAGSIAAAFVLIPLLAATVAIPGGAVQGRWLLPVVTFVPLLCAVLLDRDHSRANRLTSWAIATVALWALMQFFAVYLNGRDYAVARGATLFFFQHPVWVPAHGWLLWLVLALAGAALCFSSSLVSTLRAQHDSIGGPPT